MTDIILIIDTVLIFIIVLYELLVLLTGKKRMGHLTKWMERQEEINTGIIVTIEELNKFVVKPTEENND